MAVRTINVLEIVCHVMLQIFIQIHQWGEHKIMLWRDTQYTTAHKTQGEYRLDGSTECLSSSLHGLLRVALSDTTILRSFVHFLGGKKKNLWTVALRCKVYLPSCYWLFITQAHKIDIPMYHEPICCPDDTFRKWDTSVSRFYSRHTGMIWT